MEMNRGGRNRAPLLRRETTGDDAWPWDWDLGGMAGLGGSTGGDDAEAGAIRRRRGGSSGQARAWVPHVHGTSSAAPRALHGDGARQNHRSARAMRSQSQWPTSDRIWIGGEKNGGTHIL